MSEKPQNITPESTYLNRRLFLKTSIYAATGLATAGAYRFFRGNSLPDATPNLAPPSSGGLTATSFHNITNYNNFYEFSTSKEAVASAAKNWQIPEWNLAIGGLVEDPYSLDLTELRNLPTEERIYRFRCVEGWSMVIPWQGISLHKILEKAKPTAKAKYVAFETYLNPSDMPSARFAGIPFPYVEGLRLDEALHPLTLLATGLYGKSMPNQNGAPIRLVVPWKYGFKSIKSVVKITLTEEQPPTTWNLANSDEYGFYSNVNPEVDHPRWSQKQERLIGELGLRPTLPFNGYSEVASLYAGMDLKKFI